MGAGFSDSGSNVSVDATGAVSGRSVLMPTIYFDIKRIVVIYLEKIKVLEVKVKLVFHRISSRPIT